MMSSLGRQIRRRRAFTEDGAVFTIGEFSKITGLTVKTLRFYHDKDLLVPALVDGRTNYRYYDYRQIDKARIIAYLRQMDFSLDQIGKMLADASDEADFLDFLEKQRTLLEERLRRYRGILGSLSTMIRNEREARMAMQNAHFDVEEKQLDTQLIAGVRMKGRYRDSGKGFAQIGRAFGRHIAGKCFLLHYDGEYRAEDADFEACMPLWKAKAVPGIDVRELPGGRCVSLMHKGPYEELGRSYAKVLAYVKEKNYEIALPTREVYWKGPGMFFRGNPKNYLTEIQLLIRDAPAK